MKIKNRTIFEALRQTWVVENYDDTSGKYICRSKNSGAYHYFTEDWILQHLSSKEVGYDK